MTMQMCIRWYLEVLHASFVIMNGYKLRSGDGRTVDDHFSGGGYVGHSVPGNALVFAGVFYFDVVEDQCRAASLDTAGK